MPGPPGSRDQGPHGGRRARTLGDRAGTVDRGGRLAGNPKKVLARVRRNKGAPGLDSMTAEELGAYLKDHWPEIRSWLLGDTYEPQLVRRVKIPRASGGVRLLGVPTVLHRFIPAVGDAGVAGGLGQKLLGRELGVPARTLGPSGGRAQEHIRAGFGFVVDLDLEKSFDRVNHEFLMGPVAERVSDPYLLRLIRGFSTAGVLHGGLVGHQENAAGWAGVALAVEPDARRPGRDLEKHGHCFVRYAGDCKIYVQSRRAGERVMTSVTDFLARWLKLTADAV